MLVLPGLLHDRKCMHVGGQSWQCMQALQGCTEKAGSRAEEVTPHSQCPGQIKISELTTERKP